MAFTAIYIHVLLRNNEQIKISTKWLMNRDHYLMSDSLNNKQVEESNHFDHVNLELYLNNLSVQLNNFPSSVIFLEHF